MTAEVTVAYAEKLEHVIDDLRTLCDHREHQSRHAKFMPPLVSTYAIRRILRRHNV